MVKLVGILNVTPDSFSDGGRFMVPDKALTQAKKLFADGAALVDVGAESTRPGAAPLTADEEWQRLEPVLDELLKLYPGKLSLDTYHPETAEKALAKGDLIINDVTGLSNPDMVEAVSRRRSRCVIGHMPGGEVQAAHQGEPVNDIQTVTNDLLAKAEQLIARGLPKDKIILDPGIGFGKTPELNQKLLKFAQEVPDYQVMIGYSRKRFLGEKKLELKTNLEAGRAAVQAGAAYLRVHDVAGHRELLY